MMDVSIIIVNYNTHVLLKNIVESLYEKTINVSFELIIVDNNSKIRPSDYLSSYYEGIMYIDLDENVGFGRANNEGIKIAKGRNILFLNPDTILINNAIKILSDYLDNNEKVGACGGNLYDENLECTSSFRQYFPSIFEEINSIFRNYLVRLFIGENNFFNYTDKPLKVKYIVGADLMIKKSILDEVGFFDPRFFMFYEETELCWRIKHNNYNIVCLPNAKIQHLEGRSFESEKINQRKIKMMLESRKIFYSLCYSSIYGHIANAILYFNLYFKSIIFKLFRPKYKSWQIILSIFKDVYILTNRDRI